MAGRSLSSLNCPYWCIHTANDSANFYRHRFRSPSGCEKHPDDGRDKKVTPESGCCPLQIRCRSALFGPVKFPTDACICFKFVSWCLDSKGFLTIRHCFRDRLFNFDALGLTIEAALAVRGLQDLAACPARSHSPYITNIYPLYRWHHNLNFGNLNFGLAVMAAFLLFTFCKYFFPLKRFCW